MTVDLEPRHVPPSLRARFRAPELARSPWPLAAVLGCAALTVVGLASMLVGWYGASHEGVMRDQIAWGNLATVGLLATGCAQAAWVMCGRRAVGARARALDLATAEILGPLVDEAEPPTETPRLDDVSLVSAKGLTRYHRQGCLLVKGRSMRSGDRTDFERAGLRACGACHADRIAEPAG